MPQFPTSQAVNHPATALQLGRIPPMDFNTVTELLHLPAWPTMQPVDERNGTMDRDNIKLEPRFPVSNTTEKIRDFRATPHQQVFNKNALKREHIQQNNLLVDVKDEPFCPPTTTSTRLRIQQEAFLRRLLNFSQLLGDPNLKNNRKDIKRIFEARSGLVKLGQAVTPKKRPTKKVSAPTKTVLKKAKKAHKCTVCGKQFFQKCHLNRHLKQHTGKKTHFCLTCKRGFYQKSNLASHMLTHSTDKSVSHPFPCSCCQKRFTRKHGLLRHLTKQHKIQNPEANIQAWMAK